MKVSLKRLNEGVHFSATNSEGNEVLIDGPPAVGGVGGGFRPMELVLVSVASCSVMDLIAILRKQKQDLKDVRIDVEGERDPVGDVKPFRKIHLRYRLYGDVQLSKAEKAAELAVRKYCSVAEMLKATVEIDYSIEILPAEAVSVV